MKSYLFLLFLLTIFLIAPAATRAQSGVDAAGRPLSAEEDIPQSIKETLVKNRIEQDKKAYDEMLERGAEAARLSAELEASFNKHNDLSAADRDKLRQVEKLIKKIRGDLGADGDDAEMDAPLSPQSAVEKLKETTAGLYDELKKMTRYSISAAAIESSNTLIKVVRFLRGKN